MDRIETNTRTAKRLLSHYLSMAARRSGGQWGSDNDAELSTIIDAIIEAAAEEGARRALRCLPASVLE